MKEICTTCNGTKKVEFRYPAHQEGGNIRDEEVEEKDCKDCE